MLLRVGSRGSRLALTQAERATAALRRPGVEIALVPITTAGDRDRSRPFGEIGARGVFVKELEEALLEGRIDVAVHSAKDMTSSDTHGLAVGAYTAREDARDALCGAGALAPGMRVGTASARRKAQLLALEPTLVIEPLRGNIDTRLRKRGERGLDAIVLAACGLDRLGLAAEIGHRFDPDEILPEAGQGALALQVRAGEEHLVAHADAAETRVGSSRSAAAWLSSAAAASHRLPPTTTAPASRPSSRPRTAPGSSVAPATTRRARRRARGRRRDAVTRSAHSRHDPVRVLVTRPTVRPTSCSPGWASAVHDVVHCPLIEMEPIGDEPIDVAGYDWVIVTSANGARSSSAGRAGRSHRLPRSVVPPPRRSAAPTSCRASRRQEGLLAELPRPAGRVLFAGAEGARRLLVDELGADFVALYRTRELHPRAARRATSSCSRHRRRRARFAAARSPISRRLDRAGDDAAAREPGSEVVAEAETHDLDGLVAAVGRPRARR